MKVNIKEVLVGALLIAIAVFSRVVLHVPNFAALAAVGLFAGFYFRETGAFVIPLLAVFISDLFIGFYDLGVMVFVYAAWLVPVFIGKSKLSFRGRNQWLDKILTIGSKALASSLAFYMISNLGVWLFSGMYQPSFAGLLECYLLAVPFFRATVLGDLAFSGLLFGTYYLVSSLSVSKNEVATVKVRK